VLGVLVGHAATTVPPPRLLMASLRWGSGSANAIRAADDSMPDSRE
jgi:hypothetical protein